MRLEGSATPSVFEVVNEMLSNITKGYGSWIRDGVNTLLLEQGLLVVNGLNVPVEMIQWRQDPLVNVVDLGWISWWV